MLKTKWTDYERLEFFGDAILNFLASKWLFYENDGDTPHLLTVKRQSMVRSLPYPIALDFPFLLSPFSLTIPVPNLSLLLVCSVLP